jgi:hypothetical protein
MINRRGAFRLALAGLASAGLLPSSVVRAQQGFQRFVPFLVDLQGWKGGKADGVAMEMSGTSMITAKREYERGDARLSAQVISGPAAQGALAATSTAMKIETADGRMSTSTIDGLPVTQTFKISDKSGVIIVALGNSAMFSLTFNGVTEDEALSLAKTFNWKGIQSAIVK